MDREKLERQIARYPICEYAFIRTEEIRKLQEEVRLHDPYGALDGKEDGLYFYRRIVKESRSYLEQGGMLIFEIGYDQGEALEALLRDNGFVGVRIVKDAAGNHRVACGQWPGAV